MNIDINSNTQFYNYSTSPNMPYNMQNHPTVPVIPLQRGKKWTVRNTLLAGIGMILFIIGIVCIILANVTCVFQVIATPEYSERKQGRCCEQIYCTSTSIIDLYDQYGFTVIQNQNCYYCSYQLYADKLVSGLGSGIAGLGVLLIIIAFVLYRKS